MNTDLLNTMSKIYQTKNACHNYILGFTFKGVVYAVVIGSDDIAQFMKLDKASRGKAASVGWQRMPRKKA